MTTTTTKERCSTCHHQRRFHHYANTSAHIEGKQFCSLCENKVYVKSTAIPSIHRVQWPIHRVQWLDGTLEKKVTP